MSDNILFKKIWQDNDVMQLQVICLSSMVSVTTKIYVSEELIDELICQIKQFLTGEIEQALWENETKGNETTACVSFNFFKRDKLGHIGIEVYAEIADGGDLEKHNCCFFVNTEYGLLMNFCHNLENLAKGTTESEVVLHKTGDDSVSSRY